MSLAIDPLNSVKALDPRVNFARPKYLIQQGASQNTFKDVISTSFNNSTIQFSAPPPNVNVAVDRNVVVKFPIRLTFTGTSVGPTLLQLGSNDAPRSYPMSKVCSTYQVVLNNNTVTTNISDYADALLHYNNDIVSRQYHMGGTPSMLDQMINYSDYATLGSNRNVLANYGENAAENARGGFSGVQVVSDNGTTAVVDLVVYENLFISPLLFGQRDSMGLLGIQTFDITLNLGDLSRAWSHCSLGESITAVVGSIPLDNYWGLPTVSFNYLTPQINQLLDPEQVYVYPYYSIDRYPTNIGSIAGNGTSTVSSNNIQFSSIPRRVYVFVRRQNADQSYATTDTYARINSVSVNFNNKSGLLSGANSFDLWAMSVNNGLQSSWDQWNKYTGSVLCLDFARDMSLGPLEVPGVLGSYQFQINVNVKNLDSSAINYSLYIVPVSEGSFTVNKQTTVAQIGIVAPSEILQDPNIPMADYYLALQGANYYGGAFLDTLKKFGKRALSGLHSALPALKAVAPFVPFGEFASPLLGLAEKYLPKLIDLGMPEEQAREVVGSGYSEPQIKALIKQIKARRGAGVIGGSVGGGVIGGRMAPKRKMMQRLQY